MLSQTIRRAEITETILLGERNLRLKVQVKYTESQTQLNNFRKFKMSDLNNFAKIINGFPKEIFQYLNAALNEDDKGVRGQIRQYDRSLKLLAKKVIQEIEMLRGIVDFIEGKSPSPQNLDEAYTEIRHVLRQVGYNQKLINMQILYKNMPETSFHLFPPSPFHLQINNINSKIKMDKKPSTTTTTTTTTTTLSFGQLN